MTSEPWGRYIQSSVRTVYALGFSPPGFESGCNLKRIFVRLQKHSKHLIGKKKSYQGTTHSSILRIIFRFNDVSTAIISGDLWSCYTFVSQLLVNVSYWRMCL